MMEEAAFCFHSCNTWNPLCVSHNAPGAAEAGDAAIPQVSLLPSLWTDAASPRLSPSFPLRVIHPVP